MTHEKIPRGWDEATTEILGDGRVLVALRRANPHRAAAVLHRDTGVPAVVVQAHPGPAGWTAVLVGEPRLDQAHALRDRVAEILAREAAGLPSVGEPSKISLARDETKA